MSIITDEVYNNLQWRESTIESLQELIQGATVLEADAIDAPLIDGAELVLKDKKGQLLVISFNADIDHYVCINDVIRSHKSQTQHIQYLELEEEREAEKAKPLYMLWAVAPPEGV